MHGIQPVSSAGTEGACLPQVIEYSRVADLMSIADVHPEPVDAETLARLRERSDRCELARELPMLLTADAPPGSSRMAVRFKSEAGTSLAAFWSPDSPPVATTVRIGMVALDRDGEPSPATASALRSAIAFIFRTTAACRVERVVHADDAVAVRACRRAGFTDEGRRRQAILVGGRPGDARAFSTTRATFVTGPPPEIRRIALVTGGGDAPGLNAVIRAVVKTANIDRKWEVVGVEGGFDGLLGEPRTRLLTPNDVGGLLPRGGTILGTSNRGKFNRKHMPDGTAIVPDPPVDEASAALRKLGADALIVIGGDGSQAIAEAFARRGIRVVGVPKTIDNDLGGTDGTFGFSSAVEVATDAIDRLHTTAESHGRVMVLEVMGRTAGWIAVHAAIAGGADACLIPEIPFDLGRVAAAVDRRSRLGHHFSIVVVAEGAAPVGGSPSYQGREIEGKRRRLGGIGEHVAAELEVATGKECRTVVLGHLQRGGTPSAFDRLLATAFGTAAVAALAEGRSGCVVALNGNDVVTVPISEVAGRVRRVSLDAPLLALARALGIELGG